VNQSGVASISCVCTNHTYTTRARLGNMVNPHNTTATWDSGPIRVGTCNLSCIVDLMLLVCVYIRVICSMSCIVQPIAV